MNPINLKTKTKSIACRHTSDPTQSGLATVLENICPYDIGQLCHSESILSDFRKIYFSYNCWKPSTSTKLDAQYCKSKNIKLTFLETLFKMRAILL